MRVVVDFDKCTGLGLCESLAPDFFEVQEDGSLEVMQYEVSEDARAEVRRAVQACPTEALRLEN